ncbi:MAG: dihydrouridine synthase family protein [Proteobacteria bacterium]|nr:dihydrouridine synthase family protein [Pseudomonadota bacterium]
MPRLLLAPMEGLVDAVMREALTRAAAYDWCVTEFVRVSNTVLPARVYTRVAPELLRGACTAAGVPVRVQLLGSDPGRMGACAATLAGLNPAGVDLNFGCPAPMVNRHGGGSILLDEPELLYRITGAVKDGVAGRVPLSAKMRLGVRDTHRAIEAAQALVAGGAELLVVHARTKEDGYRPPAHWPWIARIAEAVNVPVVGNGEIWNVADYQRCVAESGCQQLMLGRGAVADPFLAERIRAAAAGLEPHPAEVDWARLLPVIGDFWQGVLHKLEPHQAPGRIKQWLNLLRRTFPQAEHLHQRIRPLRQAAEVTDALQAAGAF